MCVLRHFLRESPGTLGSVQAAAAVVAAAVTVAFVVAGFVCQPTMVQKGDSVVVGISTSERF